MSTAQCQVAGERFVAGMVTNAVARVMFRPLGGADPVDLPVYPLADAPDVRAYGGFVGDPPARLRRCRLRREQFSTRPALHASLVGIRRPDLNVGVIPARRVQPSVRSAFVCQTAAAPYR